MAKKVASISNKGTSTFGKAAPVYAPYGAPDPNNLGMQPYGYGTDPTNLGGVQVALPASTAGQDGGSIPAGLPAYQEAGIRAGLADGTLRVGADGQIYGNGQAAPNAPSVLGPNGQWTVAPPAQVQASQAKVSARKAAPAATSVDIGLQRGTPFKGYDSTATQAALSPIASSFNTRGQAGGITGYQPQVSAQVVPYQQLVAGTMPTMQTVGFDRVTAGTVGNIANISAQQVQAERIQAERIRAEQIARGDFDRAMGVNDALAQRGDKSIDYLEQAALGQVDSAAALQGRQQLQVGLGNAAALGASARGGADVRAAAQRQAMLTAGDLQGKAINDAAILRAQEQATARGQLVGAIGQEQGLAQNQAGMYGTMATNQANLNQNANLANQATSLAAAQSNQASALQASLGNQAANLAAAQSNQNVALQSGIANLNANMGAQYANQNAGLQASIANQSTYYNTSLANLNAYQGTQYANQSTGLAAGIANAGNALQAQTSNASNWLQGSQLELGALGQAAGIYGIQQSYLNQGVDQYNENKQQTIGNALALSSQDLQRYGIDKGVQTATYQTDSAAAAQRYAARKQADAAMWGAGLNALGSLAQAGAASYAKK